MNKIKRLLAVLVCMAMVLAVVPCVSVSAAESGTCGENLTWTLDGGVLTISGTGAMKEWSWDSSVPWYDSCSSIKKVVIESGVTSIGSYAFYNCSSLTSVTIPDSVTSIGEDAFCWCSSLTSVEIPNSVTSIGWDAFYNCSSLTSVEIPDSVTSIEYGAFGGCSSLTSVEIPNSVTSIGNSAFYNCSSLTSVTIGSGVTSIGNYAFDGCSNLTSINVSDENSNYTDINGVLFTKDVTVLVQYPAGTPRTEYNIPNSVTSIGNSAFYGCSSLTSVEIPNSVTSIGKYAFYGCSGLTSVTIPDGVMSIGSSAFYNCSSLTSVTIPDGVTSIGSYTFYNCSSLMSVTIPDSVTSIEWFAFYGCSGLTSVTIPDGVMSIGSSAFYNCSSLTSVTIPDSVTSIGSSAFSGCSGLTSVTIPDSVTSIGWYAFSGCSGLTSVTIPAEVGSIGSSAIGSSVTIYGYTDSEAEDYAAANGNEFISLGGIEIEEIYVETEEELREAIKSYKRITLADGVYTIDDPLYITNRRNISITAEHEGKAEILSTNRESPVVWIESSKKIQISGIIFGHIYTPDAEEGCGVFGYVIYAADSEKINVSKCDLFGCGVVGIYSSGTSEFYVEDCVIRDCTESGIWGSNPFSFTDCVFSGNSYEYSDNSCIDGYNNSFYNCLFLNNYSQELKSDAYDNDETVFEDCVFENNAWDGFTPEKSGVCLNGITWRVEEDVLYLGFDLEFEDGTVVQSESGEVLPYSYTSLPWRKCAFSSVVTAEGIEYTGEESNGQGSSCGVNLTWTLDGGVLTISGTGDMYDWNWDDSPWYDRSSEIKNVIIESGVTSIGDSAFSYCYHLTSVEIGSGVTSIGYDAFYGCSSLTRISVSDENLSYTDIDGVLFTKDATELVLYPGGNPRTEYSIPDSVTSIGDSAFSYCYHLTSVEIPDSVTSIGDSAFSDCYNLTSVEIGSGVTSIGWLAFEGCNSLTDVYYGGSEDEWDEISIGTYNDCLTNARIHCDSAEPEPVIVGVECALKPDKTTGAEVIAVAVETEAVSSGSAILAVGFGEGGEYIDFAEVEDGAAQLDKDVKTVKVFVWESLESMKPLCEAKEASVR